MALHDHLLDLATRLAAPFAPTPHAPAPTGTRGGPDCRFGPTCSRAHARSGFAARHFDRVLCPFSLAYRRLDNAWRGNRGPAPYVARNFEHGQMMKICTKYTGWAVDKTGQPVPAEIQRIADCFVQLQESAT